MLFKQFSALLACLIGPVVAVIRPSNTIYTNDVFYAYLDYEGKVKNCWYKIGFDLDIDDKKSIDLTSTTPIETLDEISILPFSETVCGVRGNMSQESYALELYLEAEYMNGEYDRGSTKIFLEPTQPIELTEITTEIGLVEINCSQHTTQPRRCLIVADTGERWDRCELQTTIRANRSFDCYVHEWGNDIEKHEHIKININSRKIPTNGIVQETAASIILRCQFIDPVLRSCQAQLPFQRGEFFITDDTTNGRYSSYDTDIRNSKCAIEIPKPLGAEHIGLWRIINSYSQKPTGCIFYIGHDKNEIIENELKLIRDKIFNIYKEELINGNVSELPLMAYMLPFAIRDCYMVDPNRVVYLPQQDDFDDHSFYGYCSFANLPVIEGKWKFGALGYDYEHEVLREMQVRVKPYAGEVLTSEITAERGDSVELFCRSSFEEPITYCLFVDPLENVHFVSDTRNNMTMSNLKYQGRGLAFGDCGLIITEVQDDNFGTWQCQFQVVSHLKPSIFNMQLV